MAKRASARDDRLASPRAIRRRMARTRAALTEKFDSLKEQVFDQLGVSTRGGSQTMPAKTTRKTASPSKSRGGSRGSARKTSSARTGGKSLTKRGGTKTGAARSKGAKSRKTSAVARKAKKVAGRVLAGAAQGAVAGAVEAVLPQQESGNRPQSRG